MTLIIGLTGGIGSGKSTVAQLFQKLKVPVFDTDTIARELTEPHNPVLKEIINEFGEGILDKSGNFDRNSMREKVFADASVRDRLEKILHPKIREALLTRIDSCDSPYCIAVIPLLIEKGWQNIVDRILVIDLPEELQLSRAMQRDNSSSQLIRQIMQTQVDRERRLSLADDVIDNTGSEEKLAQRVNQLHEKYLSITGTQ